MSEGKKILTWAYLLSKRLYKKITFLAILLFIPLLTVAFGILSEEDSGVVTIALAREDANDVFSGEVIQNLTEEESLIRFRTCDSPEEAERAVRSGKADGAWIFPAAMEERVAEFLSHRSSDSSVVCVLERERTVTLRLASEKLSLVLFECFADDFYRDFVRENAPELSYMSDEELDSYYADAFCDGGLFSVAYTDGAVNTFASKEGYLTAPLRGLLSVLIVLCGLATSVYYSRDRREGLFSRMAEWRLPFVEFGYQTVSLVNCAAAVLIALAATGLTGNLLREIFVLLLYCICVAFFCCLVRSAFGEEKAVGVLIPLLTVVMIGVCPVFFDLKVQKIPGALFPPTYYLNAVNSDYWILSMVFYTAVLGGLYCIVTLFRRRRSS